MKSFKEMSLTKKVKGMLTKEKVKAFFSISTGEAIQLAVMVAVLMVSSDTSFAQRTETTGGSTVSSITSPIQNLTATIQGPIAKAIGATGIVIAGVATGMNFENNATKRALQLTGGLTAGIGGASIITDQTMFGLLF